MAVLRPLKLVIDNFPRARCASWMRRCTRRIRRRARARCRSRASLYVDRDDFREDPPKDWFRLAPGREVRLRYACLVRCTRVVKDASGEVTELHAHLGSGDRGAAARPTAEPCAATLHWVSAAHAAPAEVRLYDRLFAVENPGTDEGKSFLDEINPDSIVRVEGAVTEPYLAAAREARHACPVRARRLLLPRPRQRRRASRSGTAPSASRTAGRRSRARRRARAKAARGRARPPHPRSRRR